jgi:hypothetical protein
MCVNLFHADGNEIDHKGCASKVSSGRVAQSHAVHGGRECVQLFAFVGRIKFYVGVSQGMGAGGQSMWTQTTLSGAA